MNEGECMDPSVKLAIISAIEDKLDSFSKEILRHIDLKFDPLKETVDRHGNDINDLYEKHRDILIQISALSQRQSVDEGNRAGRDEMSNFQRSESELTWGKVAGIVALVSALTGVLVHFM